MANGTLSEIATRGSGIGTTRIFSHFEHYLTDGLFTTTATDSGSVAVQDSASGAPSVIKLTPSDGSVTNNDETYVTTDKVFLFLEGKPLIAEARVKFTEGATDDVNILFGFSSAAIADSLVDDGGGPPATYSGATMFKVDGGTVMQTEVSKAGVQVTDTDVGTRISGSWQVWRIVAMPIDAVTVRTTFYINNVQVSQLDMSITSHAAMHGIFGIKNGADTTAEGLFVDYARFEQVA